MDSIENQNKEENINDAFPFKKENYTIMLVGLAVLFLGFVIMSLDGQEFGFGFMGLTLGPIVVFSAAISVKIDFAVAILPMFLYSMFLYLLVRGINV